MTDQDHEEAIDLLYRNIGALPHPAYGVINVMPFSVDSDQVNALKRQVCEGIVQVLANAGFPMGRQDAPARPVHDVTLNCRMCSSPLMNVVVSDGVANVPAANVIAAMARLNPECPHKPLTADDQRRKIEEAVRIMTGEGI